MRDLHFFINECEKDLEKLGIKHGRVREFSVNTRAKCRWGQCKKVGFGLYDVSISAVLLDETTDAQNLKNTIVHELLHTVSGCFNHTGKWKLLAETVNRKLPQYNIKRTTSYEEIGITDNRKEPVCRYILKCKNCGAEISRQRLSKAVKNYRKYRCAKCGGKLERIL